MIVVIFENVYFTRYCSEARCGGIFISYFIANFPTNLPVKNFLKIGQLLPKIWTNVCSLFFWWLPCIESVNIIFFQSTFPGICLPSIIIDCRLRLAMQLSFCWRFVSLFSMQLPATAYCKWLYVFWIFYFCSFSALTFHRQSKDVRQTGESCSGVSVISLRVVQIYS